MIYLRAVKDDDMQNLVDLWIRAWKTLPLGINFEGRRNWLPGHLAQLQASGSHLIGVDKNGEIFAFMTINPHTGWMDQMVVDPDFFGFGVAKMLADEAKRISPGFIELDVNKANERAIRFYRRQGFNIIGGGRSQNSGLDTHIMRWSATAPR